jgi:hypothetical protein
MLRRSVLTSVLVALLTTSFVEAKPIDKRAQVTIQVSQLECVAIWGHLRTRKLTSDVEQEASDRIEAHLGFVVIRNKIKSLAVEKKELRDDSFSSKRVQRSMARDDLELLIKWVTASSEYPIGSDIASVITPLRSEFQEVLAGRNPYDGTVPMSLANTPVKLAPTKTK